MDFCWTRLIFMLCSVTWKKDFIFVGGGATIEIRLPGETWILMAKNQDAVARVVLCQLLLTLDLWQFPISQWQWCTFWVKHQLDSRPRNNQVEPCGSLLVTGHLNPPPTRARNPEATECYTCDCGCCVCSRYPDTLSTLVCTAHSDPILSALHLQ